MTSLRASADKFLLGGGASIILQLRELSAKYPTYALVMYLIYSINRWELFALTPLSVYLFIPRDAPVGHRRGNNPVEYVIFFPRDARHRRGNNPVEYVFFIFVTRSHKKQYRILIEV